MGRAKSARMKNRGEPGQNKALLSKAGKMRGRGWLPRSDPSKTPRTGRLLAEGVEATWGNPCKKPLGLRNVSFSDLSAVGYVVDIDFFFLIKFHPDFLKKKNEHRGTRRQGARQQRAWCKLL